MITTLICQREILSTLDTTFNFILGEGGEVDEIFEN